MQDTAEMIKQLRTLSGASLLECKRALMASNGDVKLALTILRGEDNEPPEPAPEVVD
jgi:translation elongation factor EF-Ts